MNVDKCFANAFLVPQKLLTFNRKGTRSEAPSTTASRQVVASASRLCNTQSIKNKPRLGLPTIQKCSDSRTVDHDLKCIAACCFMIEHTTISFKNSLIYSLRQEFLLPSRLIVSRYSLCFSNNEFQLLESQAVKMLLVA